MTLDNVNELPSDPKDKDLGHNNNHKVIHAALKDVKTELEGRLSDDELRSTYAPVVAGGYLRLSGTTPGAVPVIKPLGDGRAGVWEFTHNDTAGYLFHLLMGQDSSAAAWLIGIGVDSGFGNGVIVRNKAKGIGLKVEQVETITSATAYGLSVEQKSALAPAVFMEQKLVTGGAAPLMSLVSYETNTTKHFFQWQGANAKGGKIRSADGVMHFEQNLEMVGDGIRVDARSNDTVAASSRHHVYLDNTGLEIARNAGAANVFYHSKIRQNGTDLVFQASDNAALGAATFETVIAIGKGATGQKKLGFFASTPVVRPSAVAVTPEAIHAALVSLGLIAA